MNYTDDSKLALMFQHEMWDKAIEHSINKHIDKELLSLLTMPVGRATLCQAIIDRRYEVQPPTIHEVPKANGKIREVYCNEPMDRVVLSIINNIYNDLYGHLIHKNCVSYQHGLGVPKIIRRVVDELNKLDDFVGYKIDISKYFDNVNKETLFKALDELDTGSPIDKIVRDYYSDDRVIIKGQMVERYKSLAQGCALGSFLANYVLRDIDKTLSDLDIIYYRYSDDILIIGKDADKAYAMLHNLLAEKGLELNPKKVERLYKDQWFTFLGCKIKGETITISDESKQRFKKEIKSRTKVKKGTKLKSRGEQRKAIKRINKYMYTDYIRNKNNFGWAEYFFNIVNVPEDIIELDNYVKDHIKYVYTGKFNHTTNSNKTSNQDLCDLGYLSMHHMWKLYKTNPDLFRSQVICKMM